jgi:hypothetical protein
VAPSLWDGDVTGGADLEHGYRRWLRWYPESFRREHEAEMLDVLMAGARVGQRRPEPMECLDLVRGGLSVRLRPRVPRSDRCAYWMVGLMYLGAVVELAVAVTVVATMSDIRSAILARDPRYTAAQWHAEVVGALVPLVVAAVLAVAFWAWVAWATGRGHRWARLLFAAFFGLNTYGLMHGLTEGSAIYARSALVAALALWCVEVAVVVLIVRTEVRTLVTARPARSAGDT